MAESGAQKRKIEDETAAMETDTLGESAQPAAKKVKIEHEATPITTPMQSEPATADAVMAGTVDEIHSAALSTKEQDNPSASEASADVKAEAVDGEANLSKAQPDPDPVQTLGYKNFKDGDEAFRYFHDLIHDLRHNQDLNEYEHKAVYDLVNKGHPKRDVKIGSGVRAFQVREHEEMTSTCFYILREDGSDDNFSIRKCICKLYPRWGVANAKQPNDFVPRGGGRGGRGGGRSAGRSPTGRGGRGGRRGARGGRGRGRGRG